MSYTYVFMHVFMCACVCTYTYVGCTYDQILLIDFCFQIIAFVATYVNCICVQVCMKSILAYISPVWASYGVPFVNIL